jgi:imidazolonepropionase-like amidohydrolase
MDILLTGDRLFDGRNFTGRSSVWIEGDEIRFAGARSDLPAECKSAERDYGDATLCPGFIDLHIHCLGTKQFSIHAFLMEDERAAALRMVPRLAELLRSGYTSARDCGSGPGVPLRDAISEGSIAGPRLYAARAGISQTGGHIDHHSVPAEWLCRTEVFRLADGADDCRRAVREQFRAGADFIKICTTGGVLSERDHSHQEQYTDEEVAALVGEAHRLGMRVASHAQGNAGVKRALRAGVDSIEHGFYLDAEAIDLFLEKDATLVPTLAIMHQICEHGAGFGIPSGSIDKARRARDDHLKSLALAIRGGVRIATGSDFIGGEHNRFKDCVLEVELLAHAGLTNGQALSAATSSAARAITRKGLPVYDQLGPKWFDRVGELGKGRLADVIVLKGDAEKDIGAVRRVEAVYQGGVEKP